MIRYRNLESYFYAFFSFAFVNCFPANHFSFLIWYLNKKKKTESRFLLCINYVMNKTKILMKICRVLLNIWFGKKCRKNFVWQFLLGKFVMSRLKLPRALSSGNEMSETNKNTKINKEAKVADKSDDRRLRGNASRGLFAVQNINRLKLS